ncbi:HAD-IIA family hydrolase [Catenisphaera adipataccumulans]|jgi:4-nitrophenyl phosphatase|uniref:Glycerol-1-phosphate dehydrogenase [NAD(P)+] n=1 Tax=Catenisphaera adipataccumulans TaxID=700500 RepID=A0A7W8CWT1_9FIRM|nr:HAD-IIA family hydrolase [Catenisphaera adipataccumulans]MBB5182776.1 glycerol-1-phosphate dehydrogenase [NAD(P)+] [Catenisphaera adipataccumulans]
MLTDLNEIKQRLQTIKTFILDMDGTIYLGNDIFPYTHRFLDRVEETNRSYYFFTNNSSKDLQAYIDKLDKMDIPITKEQMMVSTDVILEYLSSHHPGAKLYVVGTPALLRAFTTAGWTLDDEDPDVVILGFDTTLTYEKLSKLCTFIRHGKTYYGINPDLNCPVEGGEFIPDCGSIARCVESSTGVYPEFFGKPSRRTLDYIVKATSLKPGEIAIVGDRLYTDIAVADNSEVLSILVLSGETKKEDVPKSKHQPDVMVDDIGVLADLLE